MFSSVAVLSDNRRTFYLLPSSDVRRMPGSGATNRSSQPPHSSVQAIAQKSPHRSWWLYEVIAALLPATVSLVVHLAENPHQASHAWQVVVASTAGWVVSFVWLATALKEVLRSRIPGRDQVVAALFAVVVCVSVALAMSESQKAEDLDVWYPASLFVVLLALAVFTIFLWICSRFSHES